MGLEQQQHTTDDGQPELTASAVTTDATDDVDVLNSRHGVQWSADEWQRLQRAADEQRRPLLDVAHDYRAELWRRDADELGKLWRLPTVSTTVDRAELFGHGAAQSAKVWLSNGDEIVFDRLADAGGHTSLALQLAIQAGVDAADLKRHDALKGLTLLRRIADVQATATDDDQAREWGTSFLQGVEANDKVHRLDMDDQEARWDAFAMLDDCDASNDAKRSFTTIVQHAWTLQDRHTGVYYPKAAWVLAHVRAQGTAARGIDAAGLNTRMARVRWERPRSGRLHSREPGGTGRSLYLHVFVVPPGWLDGQ